MPTFTAPDGTQLAYHLLGEGEPLVCLPGGPMRASAYLGDLGGLSAHRRLVLLDLRGTGDSAEPADPDSYRCDRQVGDLTALCDHLGLDRVDLLAHSAGGDLALLFATRHPERIRSLTLVTGRARALGVEFKLEHRLAAAALRSGQAWYAEAWPAYQAVLAGTATDPDWDAAMPFYYGRWDDAARAHAALDVTQTNEPASDAYAADGAFDPVPARAVAASWDAQVLLLAGELDSGPLPAVAADIAGLFPRAELVVQPGAGHFPWLDDPAFFRNAIAGFLAAVADRPVA
jgi:pimeloyl-ACP methyl ester carboxylesterase